MKIFNKIITSIILSVISSHAWSWDPSGHIIKSNHFIIGTGSYSVLLNIDSVDLYSENDSQNSAFDPTPDASIDLRSFSVAPIYLGYARSFGDSIYVEFVYSSFYKDFKLSNVEDYCSIRSGVLAPSCKPVVENKISSFEINGIYKYHIRNGFGIFAGAGLSLNQFDQDVVVRVNNYIVNRSKYHLVSPTGGKISTSYTGISTQFGFEYMISKDSKVMFVYKNLGSTTKKSSMISGIDGSSISWQNNF